MFDFVNPGVSDSVIYTWEVQKNPKSTPTFWKLLLLYNAYRKIEYSDSIMHTKESVKQNSNKFKLFYDNNDVVHISIKILRSYKK